MEGAGDLEEIFYTGSGGWKRKAWSDRPNGHVVSARAAESLDGQWRAFEILLGKAERWTF